MKYLLDANSFIEPANKYYRLTSSTRFWDSLIDANRRGVVFSIHEIKVEILKKSDDLAAWAKVRGDEFFLKLDTTDLAKVSQVVDWVQKHSIFTQANRQSFFNGADPFLIAKANTGGYTIVTFEQHHENSPKVKIPTVCQHFNVPCIDLHRLVEAEGIQI
jgi:hypothetical protein